MSRNIRAWDRVCYDSGFKICLLSIFFLSISEIERQNRFDRNLYVWLISILIVTNLCLYTTIVKEKGIQNTDILKRIQKIWKSVGLFSQTETKRTAQVIF